MRFNWDTRVCLLSSDPPCVRSVAINCSLAITTTQLEMWLLTPLLPLLLVAVSRLHICLPLRLVVYKSSSRATESVGGQLSSSIDGEETSSSVDGLKPLHVDLSASSSATSCTSHLHHTAACCLNNNRSGPLGGRKKRVWFAYLDALGIIFTLESSLSNQFVC